MAYVDFIQLPGFTKKAAALLTDNDLIALEDALEANPLAGALVKNSGGLRKIRIPLEGRGKSGGARVIYFIRKADLIYLVDLYAKNEKESLSPSETKDLRKRV